LEAFNIRHSGLDPESRISVWIPAFAGMTTLIYANIYATFRQGKFVLFFSFQWRAAMHEFLVIRKQSKTKRTLRVSSRIF